MTQADGYVYLNPKDVFERKYSPVAQKRQLTKREREIAALVGAGKSNKEIATELNLSTGTVKVYLSVRIFPAIGVTSRVGVALWARAAGLCPLPR